MISFILFSYGQRFQATTGSSQNEDKWAVVEDPNTSNYVTIGNVANSAGMSEVWISSYAANGAILTSARATTGRPMIARDISLAPKDLGTGQQTYYITGWTQVPFGGALVNQMFVGRMYLNGAFMWYQENPFGGGGNDKEGVAIVQAPNGDAVAVGHVMWPNVVTNLPLSPQVILTRFNPAGGVLWSNTYNKAGFWKVRELAIGRPAPGCVPSPTAMPGEFVITGEVRIPSTFGGNNKFSTFAAVYNGAGAECWRNLYPTAGTTNGDAGYDVVFNPANGNYNIVGVAEMGPIRAAATSTPYLVEVNPAGALVTSAIYMQTAAMPMGLYPRCVTLTNATGEISFAGPDYTMNRTFYGKVPAVGAIGTFFNYMGSATANSTPQPFWFSDGEPEGILYTQLPPARPGYLISTNATPGPFGAVDGHFIRTDINGQTPDACPNKLLPNIPVTSLNFIPSNSTPVALVLWGNVVPVNVTHPVQQQFCRDTCIVNAAFTFTNVGSTFTFTNGSTGNGTLTYSWNFGDASTSTLANPVHTYASPGTYIVCLTTTNVNSNGDVCTSTTCITIVVPNPCNVVAGFTYTVACKYKVTFTNTSTGTGPLTYNWLFDDGSTSTAINPVKTFTSCGPHVTRLIACNSICCDTIFITVNIPCCAVVSDFCLQDSGLYTKLIYSTGMNLPTTTYTVYLDGVLTAWTANTSKLLTAGIHTVCLKARRVSCPGDTCCATCCKTISVSANCSIVADYWFQVQTTGNVVFTNKTTPAGYTSVWDFGDGSPLVTGVSPSHIYTTPGTYTACITSTIISGVDTCRSKKCKTIVIDAPCKPLAKFKTKFCISSPLSVDFINYSTGAVTYLWNFGDGNTSTSASPTHVYGAPNTYIVCLTAYASAGCWSQSCYRVIVSTATCTSSCTSLPAPPFYRISRKQMFDGEIFNDMTLESSVTSENGELKDNTKALKASVPAEIVKEEKLSLFPNPASQIVQVVYEAINRTNAEVVVVNALGNVVYKKAVPFTEGKNQFSIPLQTFSNGNYFLKINSGGNMKSTMFSVKH